MSSEDLRLLSESNRDIAWAVLSGSVRFVIPTLCFVLLYYVILRSWGSEVFGLWSLLAATQSFLALGDVGLGQILAREAGPDLSEDQRRSVMIDRRSAGRLYSVATAGLLLLLVLAYPILAGDQQVYSHIGVFVALTVSAIAAGVKQHARLDLSLAGAHGATAPTLRLQGYSQVLLLLVAFATSTTYPIEGLAAGFLLSSLFDLFTAARLIRRLGVKIDRGEALTALQSVRRVLGMIRRGRYMYLSTIGSAIREPLYRVIIASFFGLTVAGYFDIAVRSTKTAREIGVFGLSATFPYFARHYRQGHTEQSKQLIRWTLSLSLVLGTLPLALFVALCRPIYQSWIGEAGDTLVTTTVMLALWLWMTLLNVPFWYAALASNMDRKAAASIWLHTASILLLVVLVPLGMGYYGTLIVWVVGASLAQASIIYLINSNLGGGGVFAARVYWMIGLSLAVISVAASIALLNLATDWSVSLVATAAGSLLCPAVLMVGSARQDLARLLRLMRGKAE